MTKPGERTKHRVLVADALQLVGTGASVTTIAAELGVSVARAAKLVDEGIGGLPETTQDAVLTIAQLRLDAAANTARRLLDHEDPRVQLAAARDLSSIEATRTRITGSWLKPEPV